jgi:hypothetical protein
MMHTAMTTWVQTQSLRQMERLRFFGAGPCDESPGRLRGTAVAAPLTLSPSAERADAVPLVRLATTGYSTNISWEEKIIVGKPV